MIVKIVSPQDWKDLAQKAHEIVFDEKWKSELENIDFALIAEEDQKPVAYVTCQESGPGEIYLQYGGAFPWARHTKRSYEAFRAFVLWTTARYLTVKTYVANDNWPMLKFYLSVEFKITGLRYFGDEIFLEHTFTKEKIAGTNAA